MTKEMNLIFDLQLFDDPVEKTPVNVSLETGSDNIDIATVNSNPVDITVKSNDVYRTLGDNNTVGAVYANSGNDTITVGAGVGGISIVSGKGDDYVTIDSGAGGNIYVFNPADGNDTIVGWNAGRDTLQIATGIAGSYMSKDGNDLTISVKGGGSILFKSVGATVTSEMKSIKIKTTNEDTAGATVVPYAMQGTKSADNIDNTIVAGGSSLRSGASNRSTVLVIDAGAANDKIINEGSYVSIIGGDGADSITVRAMGNDTTTGNESTVTSGVTINGGKGNDYIDLSRDIYTVGSGGNIHANSGKIYDSDATITSAGHVLVFNSTSDGYDSIKGLSGADTLMIEGGTFADSDAIVAKSFIDSLGNFVIDFGKSKLTFQEARDRMFGKTFKVFYNDSNKTQQSFDLTVPKHYVDGSGSIAAANGVFDTVYNGFRISLNGGADNVTISGATIYADGGEGNDVFTLTGGTNLTVSGGQTVASADAAVTIYGGAGTGNDKIYAELDKWTDGGTGETLATHVYSFKPGDGNDSIWGYHEGDTIHVEDSSATLSGSFSSKTGNYILKIENASTSGTVELVGFKGGSTLNVGILDANGNYVTPTLGAFSTGATGYDGTAHTVIAVSGNENVTPGYYLIEKQAVGTKNPETIKVEATDDNFIVNAGASNDTITIQGASNVYVDAGKDHDMIYFESGTVVAATAGAPDVTVYSSAVTIHGGAGNDTIYSETIPGLSADALKKNPTSADYVHNHPKVYEFGKSDGKDVIYGFGVHDTINIASDSKLISVVADGNDVMVSIGASGGTKASSSIRLVNYALNIDAFNPYVNISQQNSSGVYGDATEYYVPKKYKGTNSGEDITITSAETTIKGVGYFVEALGGNDTINNIFADVTIDAGTGNDTIINTGNNVSIFGGSGNDSITLGSAVSGASILAGTGNDTIWGATNGEEGNVYEFAAGQGTNYIVNFRPGIDTIKTGSANVSDPEITAQGVKLVIGGNTIVYLKGTLKEDGTPTNMDDYEQLQGADNILINNDTKTLGNMIVGSSKADTLSNTVAGAHTELDDYVIYADAGNDVIYGGGNNVSINAGAGDDTIYATQDEDTPTAKSTITGGVGKDLIIGNGQGNVYEFMGGADTIYGFTINDTIKLSTGSTYTKEITNDGLLIKVDGSTKNTILLKGEHTLTADNSTSKDSYKLLEQGSKFYIQVGNDEVKEDSVPQILMGTKNPDDLTNDVSVDDGYLVIDALAAADTINNSGSNVSISAGAGDDTITVNDGTNVIINPGKGDDTIRITATKEVGHVFEIAKGYDNNLITGFNEKDTIHILGNATTEEDAIYKAEFYSETSVALLGTPGNAYVISLDKSTHVTILGTSDGSGNYNSLYGKTFYMQYGSADAVEYEIPKILRYNASNEIAILNNNTYDDFKIIGDGAANNKDNTLRNDGADNVYISLGSGADTITIAGGDNNTINPGKGNDYVTLGTNGHTYEYTFNDENDTILGWSSNDTFNISGATSISTLMSSIDSGNGVGKDFQLQIGSYKVTFQDTEENTVLNIHNAGTKTVSVAGQSIASGDTAAISIPKMIIGTKNADDIENDRANYTIDAGSGADIVENSGANVSINGGAGNDSIYSHDANDVSIIAGDGADTVTIGSGENIYIDGGKGNDIINITVDAVDVSISGGAGDDSIYGSDYKTTFIYGSSDGNDYIFNYNGNDVIQLGSGVEVSMIGTDAATSMTTEGFVVYLTNGKKLTFKGALSGGDYADLKGNVQFTFQYANGEVEAFTVPYEKFIDTTTHIMDNDEGDYKLIGTGVADTITNDADNVVIEALGGDDTVGVTGGASVSINAGTGNDTVVLDGDEVTQATVSAGDGADLIVSNNLGGHVYEYTSGKDTILGYNENDTILLTNATSVVQSITPYGVLLKVNGSSSNTIFLKGEFTGAAGQETDYTKYEMLPGNTKLNIISSSGDDISETVQSKYLGKADPDDFKVSLKGYVVEALAGNDKISVGADSVSINAGVGADTVTVSSGNDVTIMAGKDNDLISVTDASGTGHVFQFATGDGINTITGFGENDSIHLTNSTSLKSAYFETANGNEYFVLTLDNNTKIYLQEATPTANSELRGKNFYIQYKNDTVASAYTMVDAHVLEVTDNKNKNWVAGTDLNAGAAIIATGTSADANQITVTGAASQVSIFAGAGNDTITVDSAASDFTINAGKGNDVITLNSGGHVIEFDYKDGKDSIYGWDATNVLKITGATSVTESVVINDYILKIGSGQITFKDIDPETPINIEYVDNGTTAAIEVPKLKIGTTGNDDLSNTISGFEIQGLNGNDTIISDNSGNKVDDVTILAGSGHDTVDANGDRAYIEGGAGNDSIYLMGGEKQTVNAGTEGDFITIASDVNNAVIDGGKGNDVIYTNDMGNIIQYSTDGGTDTIFAFNGSDSIKLGEGISISVKGTGEDTVYATEMAYEGFIIYLSNKQKLILKGARKEGATGNNVTDFEDLEGGTPVKVYQNGSDEVTNLLTPYEKHISTKSTDIHTIANDSSDYSIIGADFADTVVNDGESVSITTGKAADFILNTGDNVYIDAGTGNDTIYLEGDNIPYNAEGSIKNVSGASNNTIYGGAGDDLIYGNGNGHVYKFVATEQGKDTIQNFNIENDVIYLGNYQAYYGPTKSGSFTGDENLITATFENVYNEETEFYEDDTKNAILKFNAESLYLTGLEVGSSIKYSFETEDGTIVDKYILVKKEHVMSRTEDSYNNTVDNNYIVSKITDKADTITNDAVEVSISSGSGADTIGNTGTSAYINAGIGNDTITNAAVLVSIEAGEGDDIIESAGDDVQITAGIGNDTITVTRGSNVVINAGEGADFVTIDADVTNSSIKAGDGKDTIELGGSNEISVEGGADDDLIKNSATDGGNIYIYTSGDGNDTIEWKEGDELRLALDANSTFTADPSEYGYQVKIYTPSTATTGTVTLGGTQRYALTGSVVLSDTIDENTGYSTLIKGGTHINIRVSIDGVAVDGVDEYAPFKKFVTDNDPATINNSDPYYEIVNEGDEGKFILNINNGAEYTAANVTISAGDENDTIYNSGANVLINGGAGNDMIYIAKKMDIADEATETVVAGVSINAGEGDDYIKASSGDRTNRQTGGIIYMYDNSANNGNDTIANFDTSTDLIYIAGMTAGDYKYTVDSTDNSFVVSLSSGSIKLEGLTGDGSKKVSFIDDSEIETEIRVPSIVKVTGTTATNIDTVGALVYGDSGNNVITVTANEVLVYANEGDDSITVDSAAKSVSIYAGAGADTITANPEYKNGILYVFGASDGNNVIEGVSEEDSIQYTGGPLTGDSYYSVERDSNKNEIMVLTLGSTKVSMKGYSGGDTFTLIDTAETKTITVPRIVPGTESDDILSNDEDNYEIRAKEGKDSIVNTGDNVLILADKGIDTIKNSGANVSIDGGADNDIILNEGGNNTSIFGGAGADIISVKSGASGLKVYGGAGSDTIYSDNNQGVIYQISSTENTTDYIYGFTSKDTIQIIDGTTFTALGVNSKSNGLLTLGVGNARFVIKGSSSDDGVAEGKTINIIDKDGNYLSSNGGANVLKIRSITEGNITTNIEEDGVYITGTASVDNINNTYKNVSILAGGGNDVIDNSGASTSIVGGAGADNITNSGDGVSIWGGAASDYITNSNTGSNGVVYQFGVNEGTDTIYGFNIAHDKIYLSGVTGTASLPKAIVLDANDNSHTKFTFAATQTTIEGIAQSDIISYANEGGKNSVTVLWGPNKTETEVAFVREYSGTDVLDNNTSIALKLTGSTTQEVHNTAAGASIGATANDNIITNNATGSENAIFKFSGGSGADHVTNDGAYASIAAGAGANEINNSAANVTITAGAGDDQITSSGTNGAISIGSGAGNDAIDLSNAHGNFSIYAAAGNDTITANSSRSDGDTYDYWISGQTSEGADVIKNFSIDQDKLHISYNQASITAAVDSSNSSNINVRIAYYGNVTTLKLENYIQNPTTDKITYYSAGTEKQVKVSGLTVGSSRVAEEPIAALDDLFADDNYISNDAQISDITAITQDNYSAGNIETFDLENITKSSYTPSATYGEKK